MTCAHACAMTCAHHDDPPFDANLSMSLTRARGPGSRVKWQKGVLAADIAVPSPHLGSYARLSQAGGGKKQMALLAIQRLVYTCGNLERIPPLRLETHS